MVFLSPGSSHLTSGNSKFAGTFDGGFVACSVTHLITDKFMRNFRGSAAIWVETPLFLLHVDRLVEREHKLFQCNLIDKC